MSNAIPPILVQIAADVSQLKAGLAQAETSIKGMNNSVETANTGMQSMIASAKRMAGAVGIAFAGQQVLQFGKDVVLAASSMNESISKVNVVFGQGASAVLKFGESAATSMGLSNQQAIEAAGTYGNLFQAFGLGQTESQKMSTSLVQLAADLASFNNTSVDDALNALRSGLSGETEPLKRFGVALNETTLKNKAFAMGFGQIKGAMDPAMKAQVTYALVMEQTTLAQGDYARTASGTANTMKTLSAQFADTKVAIGDLVLPAFNALLKVTGVIIPLIKSLAKYFKDNADALKIFAIILATATVGFYAYKAALVITSTATAVYTAVTKSMAAGNSLAAIATLNLKGAFMMLNMAMKANPVGFIVTGLIALGAAFVWAWKKSETFRGIVIAGVQVILNGFAALVGGIGTFVGMLAKVPGMGWAKGIADGAKNASESIKTTAKNLGDLKKANAGYGEGAFVYPSGGTTSGTGTGGKGGGGSSSAAAAAAKEAKDKADKIKKAMSEVSDVYDKMNKEILDAQDKVAEATKRRDESTAEAHKRYNETVAEADKKFMEASAEANERYNERVADTEKKYSETKATLHKRNNEVIGSATKVYNERVADLQDRFEEQTAKAQETYAERKLEIEKNYLEKTQDLNKKHAETIEKINTTYNEKLADLQKRFNEESVKAQKNYNDKRENIEDTYADKVLSLKKNYLDQTSKLEIDAAKKSADLTKAASDKQLSIVQQSMDRLRNAFASKTGANLSEAMGEDKSAGSLLSNLKTKLTAAKDLAQNAALLQGQGFSQTFIEQVVGAGAEVGNSLAGSILNASPEAIAELQSTFVELEKTSNYGLDSLAATMNSGGKLATDELMKAYRGVSTDLATSLIEVQSSLNEKLAEANTKYQEAMTEAATVRAEGLAAAKTALDEALLASKTSFDEGVVAATKTMNDGIAEANKALAEGLAEAEKTRTEAIAEADKTLKAALAAAKKTLDDGLVEAAKALNDKITEANKDLAEGLAEAAKDRLEALADAKKDLDKALAEADKTYKETLAAAQKDLTEQLAAVQKTYTEALDKIAKDTDASIAALKTKLAELAATLTELGAKQAAIAALANAPVYTPVTTTADTSNAGSVNTTTLAGIAAASGSLTINQTINNTSVSANAVADATLAAIKFGTSGGYSFTGSMGSK